MGRAELAPVQQVHSLADLEQFVDLAALEQLGLDKPYTVDDLLKSPESSMDFIEAGSKALESLAYQLKNDEEYKVKLPEYPTSYSEGVSMVGRLVFVNTRPSLPGAASLRGARKGVNWTDWRFSS